MGQDTKELILEKIYKAGMKFLVPQSPDDTYRTIIEEAVKLVGAEYGSVVLFQRKNLIRVYSSNNLGYQTQNRQKGFTYSTFKNKTVLVVPISDVEEAHPEVKDAGIKWTIFIPLSYGNKSIGVLTLNSDRTEKISDEQVRTLKLFGSMASLAIRKTQLLDETKKALESRDIFISMAAHELRTPMTTINGYIQLIKARFDNQEEIEPHWIEELSWESFRMILLINELLTVNRIKAGKLQYSWRVCNLAEIIERSLLDFKFSHPHYKISFRNCLGDNNDEVVGDFDKLLQVTNNLLDNAAKFSPSEKEISIFLKATYRYLVLKVKDQGRGISKDDLGRIFDSFYKGQSYTNEGMGLGLFLVKNIVDSHRGSVKVSSKPRKGTSVLVKLPRLKEET